MAMRKQAKIGPQTKCKMPNQQLLPPDPFPLSNDRYASYRKFEYVGRGNYGIAYRVKDKEDRTVLLKDLDIRIPKGMLGKQGADVIVSIENEVRVMMHLDHPNIPKYIDSFSRPVEGERRFYIVTEYVEGSSLEKLLSEGRNFTQSEAKKIARQLLGILGYLQSFSPPILHRDICPNNVVMDEQKNVHLVDFGTVTLKPCGTLGGTLCGTLEYAAPEQASEGKASPSSEVYGVGATLIRILTRKDVDGLKNKKGRLVFRKYANISDGFARWIEKAVAPEADRFKNAKEALKALEKLQDDKLVLSRPSRISIWKALARRLGFGKETGDALLQQLDAQQLAALEEARYEEELDRAAEEIFEALHSATKLVYKVKSYGSIHLQFNLTSFSINTHEVEIRHEYKEVCKLRVDKSERVLTTIGGTVASGIASLVGYHILGMPMEAAITIFCLGVYISATDAAEYVSEKVVKEGSREQIKRMLAKDDALSKALKEVPGMVKEVDEGRTSRIERRDK